MLYGFADGELELRGRRGKSRRLRGRFPYNKRAVLSDGGKNGRPQKEVIASRAFSYRIDRPDEDIHLLVGHSYDRPLASRLAGTLLILDSDEAVTFDAEIVPEIEDSPYGQDFLAAFTAGLIRGISPGFRIPPPITVPDAEKVEEEDPALGRAIIRTIFAALLYEMSFVTVPAYKEAEGEEARSWELTQGGLMVPNARARALNRWRA
ncbi:HK97 family phage prohead protease [Frigidibacter sp. RF13]|uniref:HK97 family phage prohead protease n=1 Tax=Frigidibacter sp. RF13 TaxID=2997340 RepID=UPI00226F796C|nr:HK97 family phage prohead protease [Frigidibacter sp. RF13]MCY1126023.1 HK97 family phage prohead protease [Frigidibacter sp. RF13]